MDMDCNKIDDVIKKMDMSNFKPGSCHEVIVTHINNPGHFYVRPLSVFEAVTSLEVKGSPVLQQLTCRNRVIYKSTTLQKLVRGDIVAVRSNGDTNYTIHAIDYGFYDNDVSQDDIFLPAANEDCPSLAIHCQLFLCEAFDGTFDDMTIRAMKVLVQRDVAVIKVQFRTALRLVVDLTNANVYDLSIALMMVNFAIFTKTISVNSLITCLSVPPLLANRYKYRRLKLDDILHVRVLYGESMLNFYVAEMKDFHKYQQAKRRFNQHCRSQQLEDVVAAAIDRRGCAVKYGGFEKYERAIVVSVTEPRSKALVRLVDWGNTVEVRFSDIKSVESKYFYHYPAIGLYCKSMSATEPWPTSLPKFLYPGHEFMIKVLQVGDGIDIPHTVTLMKKHESSFYQETRSVSTQGRL